MNWIYDVENWVKEHWIILVITFIILVTLILVLVLTAILIKKIINYRKIDKKNKKIWKNKLFFTTNLINVFMNDLNIKFWRIELKRIDNNKKIAWYTLVGILTRVIANKYDEKYGNPKEALKSLYTFYKNLRKELEKYPSSFKTNIVVLVFMNTELRPFLTKWNFLINEKYKNLNQSEYIDEFIKDFNSMYDSIMTNKYIENLLSILGRNINTKKIIIPDGVENLKKMNYSEIDKKSI